jgi:hypothetical protein
MVGKSAPAAVEPRPVDTGLPSLRLSARFLAGPAAPGESACRPRYRHEAPRER